VTNDPAPLNNTQADSPPDLLHTSRNARHGLILFAVYVVLYGSFVALNTFDPKLMARPFLFGLNLAIVYGFTLIVAAFVLAMIYAFLCGRSGDAANGGTR
jgi:uncharacterized membrane protein (DUF485 family)